MLTQYFIQQSEQAWHDFNYQFLFYSVVIMNRLIQTFKQWVFLNTKQKEKREEETKIKLNSTVFISIIGNNI